MAYRHPHQFPLIPTLLISLLFTTITTTLAQVPPNQTFHFVNQGEFGDRIIEYDAGYRIIRNNVYTFYTFPFRLCFYNTTPNSFVFGMRAGIPNDESLMRWVWDANRNDPVGENATLSFGEDGNFVLSDFDGRLVWQTNTANKGVTGIKLLPNGNLVLFDKNGAFLWQSFDHPSDTLMVGMSVRINGRNKLVSRTSDVDGSDGKYSLVLEDNGFNMHINNSGELLVYGGWGGGWGRRSLGSIVTFDAVPENNNATAFELVLTVNQDPPPPAPPSRRRLLQRKVQGGSQINLNKLNYNATYSFLRLGSDGNLRAYTYYDQVSYLKWEESFAFFSSYFIRECGLPSKCGEYGLCERGMCVACPSPKGLLGWSDSCAPPQLPPCKDGAKAAQYYKILEVENFLNPYLDDGEGPVKVGECRHKCSRDCKCLGFIYKEDTFKCLLMPLLGTLIKDVNTTSVGYVKYSK
ncbi:hypothetical protein ACSBR2_028042 [Camellia fascicularis]